MVKFFREYWFGCFIGVFFFVFIGFTAIIMAAPHIDAQMRGFTPCTYNMAKNLSVSSQVKMSEVFSQVNKTYYCYLGVIFEGVEKFFAGQQTTPWANYLFEPEIDDMDEINDKDEEIEPYSQELLDANLLDDEHDSGQVWEIGIEEKENVNEEK